VEIAAIHSRANHHTHYHPEEEKGGGEPSMTRMIIVVQALEWKPAYNSLLHKFNSTSADLQAAVRNSVPFANPEVDNVDMT
jgi:hypothetical protein